MAQKSWNGSNDSWTTDADWDPSGVPGTTDDVAIGAGAPIIATDVGTVNSVSDSASAYVILENGGALATSQGLIVNLNGTVEVDAATYGQGGSHLSVGGTLSNAGRLLIGNGAMSADDSVTATGIDNTGGSIFVGGGTPGASTHQAVLDVTGLAGFGTTGQLDGTVTLRGNALIEFATGAITTIASDGTLDIDGTQAFLADSTDATSDSALTSLASNAGTFILRNGQSLTTTTALDNTGTVSVDASTYYDSGSKLAIGGVLTNAGRLLIGNGAVSADDRVSTTGIVNTGGQIQVEGGTPGTSTHQAVLDVAGLAGFGVTGVLDGSVTLGGNALIEFTSGGITTVASTGTLDIDGAQAFVADANNTTGDSALTRLATNAGTISLHNDASLATTTALDNTSSLFVDSPVSGRGGSHLTIGGTLTNSGSLAIGNGALSADDGVSVAALDNTGTVTVNGEIAANGTHEASLVVSGALSGNGTLTLGEHATLELGSADAASTITFAGPSATLKLDAAANFAGTLANLEIGDTIDLVGVAAASAKLTGATLHVVEKNGSSVDYKVSNPAADTGFVVESDGQGGSNLVLAPATLVPPTISTPGQVTVTGNRAASLGTLTIGDTDPVAAPLTVVLTDGSGILQAGQFGNGTVTGNGTTSVTLTGSLAEINAALASLTYTGLPVAGQAGSTLADALDIAVTDAVGKTASSTLSITDAQAPKTAATVTTSGSFKAAPGAATTITGISLSDDYVQSTGGTDALTLTYPGASLRATGSGVTISGQGTGALMLTGSPDAINAALSTGVSGTFGASASAGSISVQQITGDYDFIDFTKNNNIQSALLGQFPTGIVYAQNALRTPFDITSDANGNNFNDNQGAGLTIPVNIPPANVEPGGGGIAEVDMLINAFNPPQGANIETVEFDGVDGSNNASREVFTLVDGKTVRDIYQTTKPGVATTIDTSAAAPGALNAFTFTNTVGGATTDGGASGTSSNGATGTYNVDEQRFVLDPDFQAESLQKIIITPVSGGGTPLLLGITLREVPPVLSIDTPDPEEPEDPTASGPENPTPPQAQGDVHITTYDGLYYNFQAEGEFVLAQSTAPGDDFQVQIRLQPWYTSASVTVITEAAVAVGTDRVTFDVTRPDLVWIDGTASTALASPGASLTLNGGTLTEVSQNQYRIVENTGETVTVTDQGSYLNVAPTLPPGAGAGSVKGLLGTDSGQANDFQLADGTVLQQPLTSSQLYGKYADSWRVTDATSLLDYGQGQTTATYTNTAFPTSAIALSDLPAAVVAKAAAIVAAAGITDPTIAQGAELDYLATGDLSFVTGAAQAQGSGTVSGAAITQTSPAATSIGVVATAASVAAADTGTTPVTFQIYLTAPATADSTIDYAVTAPNASALGAAAFGGTLPSGQIVIAKGGTTANVEIDVPQGALGNFASAALDLGVSSPAGMPIFAGSASTILVSATAQPSVTGVTISPAAGDLDAGKTVKLTLTLDQPVVVTGTPRLTLNDGGSATYAGSGSGFTPSLVFTTTVAAGQNAAALAAVALQLGNAAIVNAAGTAVATSLAGVTQTGPAIDTTAPIVSASVLTVAPNAAATPIGIVAPSDNLTAAGSLAIVVGALPDDGTVTLADGTTSVAAGEALTADQLTGLAFTPTPGALSQGSTFTYAVTDAAGNVVTGTAALDIGGPGAPTITGTHASATTAEAPVTPFSGVTLTDPADVVGASETLTITLSGSSGTLSGAGLASNSNGTYTLAGSDAAVTQALEALVFTPTAGTPGGQSTTVFTLTDASTAGSSVTDGTTSVVDTAAAASSGSGASPGGGSSSGGAGGGSTGGSGTGAGGSTGSSPTPMSDTISIDPNPAFVGHHTFVLTGTASSPSGVGSVELTAEVDGVEQDLGTATLNGDGTFTFQDHVGPHVQKFITATVTDQAGGTAFESPLLSLEGRSGGSAIVAREDHYSSDANTNTYSILFRRGGSSTVEVHALGQTLASGAYDIFDNHHQARTTFAFDPGFGIDVVKGFTVAGPSHDTLDLPASDFTGIADVLRNTGDIQGSAWITDPKTGDAIRLAGVTTAELKAHPKDFSFHA